MNTSHVRSVVAASVGIWFLSIAGHAQLLQPEVLFKFAATDGSGPSALTLSSDGTFYGTTADGGSGGYGTVFRVTANGTLTTLVSFAGTNGANPVAALTLGSDGNFYGTTSGGGSGSYGTVFRVTTNGTLTTLVSFAGTNGTRPRSALALGSDGDFYGTTQGGGSSGGGGTVFRVTTNGTLTTLVSFAGTNGAYPSAGLTLGSDGNFYGTTPAGGTGDYGMVEGTVFRVTTNAMLTTLGTFAHTNGSTPYAGLTLGSDGNFYGATSGGGSGGYGTLFRVTTNGTLTTLVSFAGTNGLHPGVGLTLGSDGNFYGTTGGGGSSGAGTVFRVTTDGTLTSLVSFAKTNGLHPLAGLTLANDGNFYGTTREGGYGDPGFGVIYRLRSGAYLGSFGMVTNGFELNALNIGRSGTVVLESSPDLEHWTSVQTNGAIPLQFLDTTALDHPQQFYRLKQQ